MVISVCAIATARMITALSVVAADSHSVRFSTVGHKDLLFVLIESVQWLGPRNQVLSGTAPGTFSAFVKS